MVDPGAAPLEVDKARLTQDAKVMRDRRLFDGEGFLQIAHAHLPPSVDIPYPVGGGVVVVVGGGSVVAVVVVVVVDGGGSTAT
jgi:hypothetical protein